MNTDNGNVPDTTVGDFDDILMFTTRSTGRPFVGKCGGRQHDPIRRGRGGVVRSRPHAPPPRVAGRAGRRLPAAATASYYTNYDISAHLNSSGNLVPNTLGDLTRRECRFAHNTGSNAFPYDVGALWYWNSDGRRKHFPPCRRSMSVRFTVVASCNELGSSLDIISIFGRTTPAYRIADNALIGGTGTRVADDVILNNVIGFDVKAWDPDVRRPMSIWATREPAACQMAFFRQQ